MHHRNPSLEYIYIYALLHKVDFPLLGWIEKPTRCIWGKIPANLCLISEDLYFNHGIEVTPWPNKIKTYQDRELCSLSKKQIPTMDIDTSPSASNDRFWQVVEGPTLGGTAASPTPMSSLSPQCKKTHPVPSIHGVFHQIVFKPYPSISCNPVMSSLSRMTPGQIK